MLQQQHPESARERSLRDAQYAAGSETLLTPLDRAEMHSHINALQLSGSERVLELGAGSGRYTLPLRRLCRSVVAVDFSIEGLRQIGKRLPFDRRAQLVQADVSRSCFRTNSFDRVLSTLTSNLPTRELRHEMFKVASDALVHGGLFVFGAHHWGPEAMRRGLAKDGYYGGDGIYRYYMTVEELESEARQHFESVSVRPVAVIPPGAFRLRLPLAPVSRICEKIPVIRDFGTILMGVAQKRLGLLFGMVSSVSNSVNEFETLLWDMAQNCSAAGTKALSLTCLI